MLQLSKFTVQTNYDFATRFVRSFGGFESVKTMVFAIYANIRIPTIVIGIPKNALIPRLVVALDFTVALILRRGCMSQIFPSVVSGVMIAVIDLVFWPFAGYPKPYDSVHQISLVVYTYSEISESAYVVCDTSRFNVVTRGFFPTQNACTPIVKESIPNKFGSKIVMRIFRSAFHLLRTSSTARRITSASVIPSFVACFKIHACWDAVRTICRWMPLVMAGPFKVANRANIHAYCGAVK